MTAVPKVLVERSEHILLITINRPEQRNAFDREVGELLWEAVQILDREPDLRVGVITGSGTSFCAGMDLKEFVEGVEHEAFARFIEHGAEKPLIAAIEGFALGGGLEIALTCDLLVAAKDARLGLPEVRVGLFAGGTGLYRLPQRVGFGKAAEMALTADPISAEEGLALGLVTRVAESGEALAEALAIATRMCRNAPLSLAVSKKLLRASAGRTEEEFCQLQGPAFDELRRTDDAKEGATAFAERRAPQWTGR